MQLSRLTAILLFLGLGLFIAGFLLPAVRIPPTQPAPANFGADDAPGWVCAVITFSTATNFLTHPSIGALPVILSGCINPLVLFYMVRFALNKLNGIRPFLIGAVVVCCLVMWIFLALGHMTLLVGHYLWIAGSALILAAPYAHQPEDW